jgi:cytochrome c55X
MSWSNGGLWRAVVLGGLFALAADVQPAAAEPTPQRQAELRHLLRHDCGSCHGMTLQGGLGPALLPQRMRVYEPDFIRTTILQGRPGTPMPPWRPLLSDQDVTWLVRLLRGEGQP